MKHTNMKNIHTLGKKLAYAFPLLGSLLPLNKVHLYTQENALLVYTCLNTADRGALLLAVFVNTAEYIIRRTLRVSSHLFGWNSHFPHDPPTFPMTLPQTHIESATCLFSLMWQEVCDFIQMCPVCK